MVEWAVAVAAAAAVEAEFRLVRIGNRGSRFHLGFHSAVGRGDRLVVVAVAVGALCSWPDRFH